MHSVLHLMASKERWWVERPRSVLILSVRVYEVHCEKNILEELLGKNPVAAVLLLMRTSS